MNEREFFNHPRNAAIHGSVNSGELSTPCCPTGTDINVSYAPEDQEKDKLDNLNTMLKRIDELVLQRNKISAAISAHKRAAKRMIGRL